MKIIDLSVAIEAGIPSDPPNLLPKIQYITHEEDAPVMQALYGNIGIDKLPGGYGAANTHLELTDHAGTHLDAPWHYYPTMNNGERAWTIDEVPLDWCIGDGVVVDFTDKPDGYVCTSKDFIEYFEKIGYTLKKGDIVLVHTTAAAAWGTPAFLNSGCGIGMEGTLWLIDQGSRVMGTDAWSWDASLPVVSKRFAETQDPSILWEGHRASRYKAYCHMEKLTNLDQLPKFGFKVICLPIKIKGGSAGWVRCVAVLDGDI